MLDGFKKMEGTILVVDDEPKVIFFLHGILSPRGYQVLTAVDGESALKIIDDLYVDLHLVLLDLRMPGLQGGEVLKNVKIRYPDLPVGILTAYKDKKQECLDLGADFFEIKPYSMRSLTENVEQAIKKRKRPEEVVEIKPGYLAVATILMVDDEEEICELVKEKLEAGIESALGEYKVHVAYNADEGIKKAREIEPDIIIVDIKMQHLRGDEMIQILEAEGPRPKDYIIMTAVDSIEEKNKIRKSRRSYVPKPFDPDKFCLGLRDLCFKHGLIKELQ